MTIEKLDIYSLRNIQRASIEPSPKINLIVGKNASGKSSLLEAIYILGRARSFRASHIKQVIQIDKTELVVSSKIKQKNKSSVQLGIQFDHSGCNIHINLEKKDKAELAYSFPVLLIDPKSYKLLDGSPQGRREFLDWGIFNANDSFLSSWRKFTKALQQRNSLLKSKKTNQLKVWNIELIKYGTIVSDYREDYLSKLKPAFFEICNYFFNFESIELSYLLGWSHSETLSQILEKDLEKDIRYGFTHSGPHRCDFQLRINHKLAKDYASRGQLKLLMLALKLAQIKLSNMSERHNVCVLIDDLTAELDSHNKQILLKYLVEQNCQVFMSSTEIANFGDLQLLNDFKVFHVEHGEVKLENINTCFT